MEIKKLRAKIRRLGFYSSDFGLFGNTLLCLWLELFVIFGKLKNTEAFLNLFVFQG